MHIFSVFQACILAYARMLQKLVMANIHTPVTSREKMVGFSEVYRLLCCGFTIYATTLREEKHNLVSFLSFVPLTPKKDSCGFHETCESHNPFEIFAFLPCNGSCRECTLLSNKLPAKLPSCFVSMTKHKDENRKQRFREKKLWRKMAVPCSEAISLVQLRFSLHINMRLNSVKQEKPRTKKYLIVLAGCLTTTVFCSGDCWRVF
jgi:hypothetical protein